MGAHSNLSNRRRRLSRVRTQDRSRLMKGGADVRFGSIVLAVALSACSPEIPPVSGPTRLPAPAPGSDPPPTPAPPTPAPPAAVAFLAGMVLSNGGGCIKGAVVEIVAGQGIGRRSTQTAPCSWWDWEDGFLFTGLAPGVEVTVRASAEGYATTEATFLPSEARDGGGWHLAILELPRATLAPGNH